MWAIAETAGGLQQVRAEVHWQNSVCWGTGGGEAKNRIAEVVLPV